jgi:drug/metabolite transporter (DMT)-like permease
LRLPAAARVGLWMAFTACGFAAMLAIVRHLSAELDVFVIAFWRNVAATLLFLPWLLRVGMGGLRTRRWGGYLLRSAFFTVASASLFLATSLMPIAEVTAISFTAPLFSTLGAILFLGERVGRHRWAALGVGFLGTLVILRPGVAAFDPAALIVLFSCLTFAAIIVIGKALLATESPALVTFLLSALAVPLSLLPALAFWQWPAGVQWLWIGALGIAAIVNLYGISRALDIGDASLSQPFDFLRLPTVAAVAFVAFRELPDVWTWIGAGIIFASSIYIGRREVHRRRR